MKLYASWSLMLVTACSATGPQSIPTSSDSATGDDVARVHVLLTDAPAALESVFVTISHVEIASAEAGWLTLAGEPQRFDLLTLQNDAAALLGGAQLTPGRYSQLRLIVDSASVVAGGVEESLRIASGAKTGVKLNLDTDIAAGMTYSLVIDYDAAKSIKSTGQGYLMTPVISVKSLTAVPTESGEESETSDPGSGSGSGAGSGSAEPSTWAAGRRQRR